MQLTLLACDLLLLDVAVEDPRELERRLRAQIPSAWPDFPVAMQMSRDKLRANPALAGWWTHLVLIDAPRTIVGVCGYTGPPDDDGVVEIAYAIAPAYQGRGLATRAATELVRRALGDSRIRVIRAHTLPEHNASTRVLEKLGMCLVGPAIDPDAGAVWRWELRRPQPEE